MRDSVTIALVTALVGGWTLLAVAQEAAQEMRSATDGVYTEDQARRGRRVFRDECSSCHKADEFTVGYATAYDLFASRETMPETAPGMLDEQTYADLVAYLLQESELPPGEEELPGDPEILKTIRLVGE